jgi:hypothetical protein
MLLSSQDSVNYKITQGDTFPLRLTYKDPAGNSIDLTGFSIVLEVRDKPGGKILSATCTIGNGITVSNPTNGIIDISISPAKTSVFVLPRSAYQVQITDQYSSKTTLLQGWFLVNAGVI